MAAEFLHGQETVVYGDVGHRDPEKREEMASRQGVGLSHCLKPGRRGQVPHIPEGGLEEFSGQGKAQQSQGKAEQPSGAFSSNSASPRCPRPPIKSSKDRHRGQASLLASPTTPSTKTNRFTHPAPFEGKISQLSSILNLGNAKHQTISWPCPSGIITCPTGFLWHWGGGASSPAPKSQPVSGSRPDACFNTAADGCLTNAELGRRARELAAQFKARVEQQLSDDWGANSEFFQAFAWGADKTNAYDALAHLQLVRGLNAAYMPGKGVTIGLIDSGIHKLHEAFDYTSSVTEEFLQGAVDEDLDEFSHGTAVASLAAVAGDIKMFAVPLGSDDGSYTPITLRRLSAGDYESAQLYEYVLRQNLDILNLSFGYQGGIENYTEQDLRNNYGRAIRALAQAGKQEKTILVWAAGNAGEKPGATPSSPEILAGLAARIPELRGHSVAVVSIGPDGTISNFSNRCGIAKAFCIAAPGEDVGVASSGYYLWRIDSGTSYSAPSVSGGLAVMKQLFRGQLSNEQLVSRLFSTANDDGIYANSAIYGHGLVDFGAATNPWGIPGFMGTRSTATGTGTPISSSFVALGAPLGDSLPQALASQEIAAFDSLGAPFWYQASNFTIPASGTSLAASLQHFLHPAQLRSLPATWQFSFQEDAPAMETGHLTLSDGASRLTMEGPQGVTATVFQEVGELEGLTIAWSPKTVSSLTLEAGYLKEQQSLLGSQANGAFGQFSADTIFLGAGLNTTAGRWQLAVEGELGQVIPSIGHSLLIDAVSPLTTSAVGLEATRPFANGSALSFSLRQPLRVESGIATFALPTGRNRDGVVLGESLSASLSPSGRQLDLTAKWQFPFLAGDVSIGATRSQQPRHQHKAAPQWTVFTGYRSTW